MSKHRRSSLASQDLPAFRRPGAALLGSAALAAGLLPCTAEAALAATPAAEVGVAAGRVADVPSGAPQADDHIGLALAGLGGLGLAGAGAAGAVVFRRPPRRDDDGERRDDRWAVTPGGAAPQPSPRRWAQVGEELRSG